MAKRKVEKAPPEPTGTAKVFVDARAEFGEDPNEAEPLRRFVTGSPGFNRISGIGGAVRGRITLVWGPYRGGKSTFAARIAGDVKQAGGIPYYVDAERAVVKPWFRSVGLPDDSYVYTRPRTQEEAQDRILAFLRMIGKARQAGDVGDEPIMVAVDTVTKLVPSDMLEGKTKRGDYGLQANLFNDWLKAAVVLVEEADAILWLIAQERKDREGVWTGGNLWPRMPDYMKYRPTSGDALLFDASLGMRIQQQKSIKVGETKVGKEHRIHVMKSKLGPEVDSQGVNAGVWYTSNGNGDVPAGVDRVREVLGECLHWGILRKPKGKARILCTFDDGMYWPGEAKFREAFQSDPDLVEELLTRCQQHTDEIARRNGHLL